MSPWRLGPGRRSHLWGVDRQRGCGWGMGWAWSRHPEETSPCRALSERRWRGISNPRCPSPSAATHLSTHHQGALGGQKQLCFFASPLQWKLPEWPHRPEPWQPGLLLEREAIGSLPKVHTTPLLKGTRAESSKHVMKGCNVFVFLSSFEFFIFSPFPSLFPSLLLCPLTLRGGLQGKFIPDTLLWQACKAISG